MKYNYPLFIVIIAIVSQRTSDIHLALLLSTTSANNAVVYLFYGELSQLNLLNEYIV